MGTEKLVDADFVARLTGGSYEHAVGAVDQAVAENAELFGSGNLTTLATYAEHVIVASDDGDFYRAKWKSGDDGVIVISEVEDIDVPVYEAAAMGVQMREETDRLQVPCPAQIVSQFRQPLE